MNIKINHIQGIATICCLLALDACSHDAEFKLKGEIAGGGDKTLFLERADLNGRWFVADSVRTDASGAFSLAAAAPDAPEVMRLRLNDEYVYFPVDSTETVSLTSKVPGFATAFDVKGSEDAVNLSRFEHDLLRFIPNASNPDSLSAFKRRVYSNYMQHSQGSVVSYYILTKIVDDKPLYNADSDDYKYFAAVATAFKEFNPSDPRAGMLERVATEALKKRNADAGHQRVVEAEEVNLVEIALPDASGKVVKLSQNVGGSPTVLVFANMLTQGAPELHAQLRKLAAQGIRIVEVSFDSDRIAWREAAQNLPWITLYAGNDTAAEKVATDYNLGTLPTFFLYNSAGALTDRSSSLDAIKRKF